MLVSFTTKEGKMPRVGVVSEGKVFDLSSRYGSLRAFLEEYPNGWLFEDLDVSNAPQYALDTVTLKAPVDPAGNFFAIGANYRSHVEEAGLTVPTQPVVFTKTVDALVGPSEPMVLPAISKEMDYEGELAVFIGRTAFKVNASDGMNYVAGYAVVNDVTARDLQWMQLGSNKIVDWLSSKGLDRSTPLGPGIVSASVIGDPKKLHIKTTLNGKLMQDSSTALMVFDIPALIAFISARVRLNPGDVIATGTPVGVGGFRKLFLKDGDRVVVEIEGVGKIDNVAHQE